MVPQTLEPQNRTAARKSLQLVVKFESAKSPWLSPKPHKIKTQHTITRGRQSPTNANCGLDILGAGKAVRVHGHAARRVDWQVNDTGQL